MDFLSYRVIFKLKRECKNLKLLYHYANMYSFSLAFWSLADGIFRRLGSESKSDYASTKRHEICKYYLRTKYADVFQSYTSYNSYEKISKSCTIWTFWWQGTDNTVYPVNYTIKSIQKYAGNHKVIIIDKNNFQKYVELPKYILDKFNKGKISIAHLSDIVRVELLYRYGGIWFDGTFLLSRKLDDDIYNYPFYSISFGGKRKYLVSRDRWSIGFLACSQNNSLIKCCRDLLFAYWKIEDNPICYLLLDIIIAILYDDDKKTRKLINDIPTNNVGVWDFLSEKRDEIFNKKEYDILMDRAYIHQLTYKIKYHENRNSCITNFGRLISDFK